METPRRTVLRAAAVAGVVPAGSGCSTILDAGGTGVVVGDVLVSNLREEPAAIEITLDRDGETVLDRAVELAAVSDDETTDDDQRLVEADWPQQPAITTLEVRYESGDLSGEQTRRFDSPDHIAGGNGCAILSVSLRPSSVGRELVAGLDSPEAMTIGECGGPS